jgi:hypothetical protein
MTVVPFGDGQTASFQGLGRKIPDWILAEKKQTIKTNKQTKQGSPNAGCWRILARKREKTLSSAC